MIELVFFSIFGSFFNSLAYRIINNLTIFGRSHCPECKNTIYWYDLIPIISWVLLRGKCRICKKNIPIIYPIVEIATIILLELLWLSAYNIYQFLAYAIFFSLLILSSRTDITDMLVSRVFTIFALPIPILFSYFEIIDIALLESLLGASLGFLVVFIIQKVSIIFYKQDGIGTGDADLLALIGAFLGIQAIFFTLFIASVCASIYGIFVALISRKPLSGMIIPFIPFLSLGAVITTFLILKNFI